MIKYEDKFNSKKQVHSRTVQMVIDARTEQIINVQVANGLWHDEIKLLKRPSSGLTLTSNKGWIATTGVQVSEIVNRYKK